MSEPFELTIALTEDEAHALAQLVKRIGWADLTPLAVDAVEVQLMQSGLGRLMQALCRDGFAPR